MQIKLLQNCITELGVKELVGGKHNPRILEYFHDCGHHWVHDDELAWCSAFANSMAIRSDLECTNKLNARSWLGVGEKIHWSNIRICDVIIFWRIKEESPWGHVAFFMNWHPDSRYVNVLGGNQSNMVKIAPYLRSRILGIRRLRSIYAKADYLNPDDVKNL